MDNPRPKVFAFITSEYTPEIHQKFHADVDHDEIITFNKIKVDEMSDAEATWHLILIEYIGSLRLAHHSSCQKVTGIVFGLHGELVMF